MCAQNQNQSNPTAQRASSENNQAVPLGYRNAMKQLALKTVHRNIARSWLEAVRKRQHELTLESFQVFGEGSVGVVRAYLMQKIANCCLPHAFISAENHSDSAERAGLENIQVTFPVRWRCQPERIATNLQVNESDVHDAVTALSQHGLLSCDAEEEMLIEPGCLLLAPPRCIFCASPNCGRPHHFAKVIEAALGGVLADEGRL